jgi:hypothetical protein
MSFAEFGVDPPFTLAPAIAKIRRLGPFALLIATLKPDAHHWPLQYQAGRRRWLTRFFELRTSARQGLRWTEVIGARWRVALVYYVPADVTASEPDRSRQAALQRAYDVSHGVSVTYSAEAVGLQQPFVKRVATCGVSYGGENTNLASKVE